MILLATISKMIFWSTKIFSLSLKADGNMFLVGLLRNNKFKVSICHTIFQLPTHKLHYFLLHLETPYKHRTKALRILKNLKTFKFRLEIKIRQLHLKKLEFGISKDGAGICSHKDLNKLTPPTLILLLISSWLMATELSLMRPVRENFLIRKILPWMQSFHRKINYLFVQLIDTSILECKAVLQIH